MLISEVFKMMKFWGWKTIDEYKKNMLVNEIVEYIPRFNFYQYCFMEDMHILSFENVLGRYEEEGFKIQKIEEYVDPLIENPKYGGCTVLVRRGNDVIKINFNFDDFYFLDTLQAKMEYAKKEIIRHIDLRTKSISKECA